MIIRYVTRCGCKRESEIEPDTPPPTIGVYLDVPDEFVPESIEALDALTTRNFTYMGIFGGLHEYLEDGVLGE